MRIKIHWMIYIKSSNIDSSRDCQELLEQEDRKIECVINSTTPLDLSI